LQVDLMLEEVDSVLTSLDMDDDMDDDLDAWADTPVATKGDKDA
jgi:hypothetical protein